MNLLLAILPLYESDSTGRSLPSSPSSRSFSVQDGNDAEEDMGSGSKGREACRSY